jgi:mRNA interferase RelE/StbE
MYKLIIKKSARKELDSLPEEIFMKIDKAILSLKENPFPYPQSKGLKGEEKRRLRAGNYRVIYDG